jgi:hypothetical protein
MAPSSSMSADEYLDIDQWPRRWRLEDRDLRPGEQMLVLLKLFLLHLLRLGLARKTLRLHRDHLCALGGYPTISEAEQRSFDSTCRKLFRFLQMRRWSTRSRLPTTKSGAPVWASDITRQHCTQLRGPAGKPRP